MAGTDSEFKSLQGAPLEASTSLAESWGGVDFLSFPSPPFSRYLAAIASSSRCVEAALRLRYRVFNLELGEGLSTSSVTGLDRDAFDDQMVHLVLLERKSGEVVGTYRLQPVPYALSRRGLYCDQEYDLEPLSSLFDQSVECGRACIAKGHRTYGALMVLWLAIGEYLKRESLRYLFGCCSLTSSDPADGWRAMKELRRKKLLHPSIFVRTRPKYDCGPAEREFDPVLGTALPLPKLFRAYMELGAKVISGPALDREFGTVDFLVLLDGLDVTPSRFQVLGGDA